MTRSRILRVHATMLRTCAVLTALVAAGPVTAEGWHAAWFDPPREVATATDRAAEQITYTVYADLVIRKSDTDTPDPEDAALVPLPGGTAPDCAARPGPKAVKLATGGQRFLGRGGGFLIFEQASTNGTMPFAVLDVATGRTPFEDATTYEDVDSVAVDGATVQLAFRHAVQCASSIPKQRSACWARIVREAKIPEPELVAALPDPVEICAAAYRADQATRDADSIVFFPVGLPRRRGERPGPVSPNAVTALAAPADSSTRARSPGRHTRRKPTV